MNRLNVIKHVVAKKERERYETSVRELRGGRIPLAREAGIDGLPELGDYDVRGRGDVVLSGPILSRMNPERPGPGRVFSSAEAAYIWAKEKYGEERVQPLHKEEAPRWAVLVRNLRK